jgi:enoyl-CoA hydratase/carnithine racemase
MEYRPCVLLHGLRFRILGYAHREFGAPERRDGVRDKGGGVSLAIFACKKLIIVAINGAAVGVGATMTLAMDVLMTSDKACIGFVFGKLGIVPAACRYAPGARMGSIGRNL